MKRKPFKRDLPTQRESSSGSPYDSFLLTVGEDDGIPRLSEAGVGQ